MEDSAAGEEDEEEVVAVLDRDSWEDRTQEAELALVHFHTDWCRHCRSPQYIARWQIKYLIFVCFQSSDGHMGGAGSAVQRFAGAILSFLSSHHLAVTSGEAAVLVAAVDCNAADSVNKALCAGLGVRGVPAIRAFRRGVQVRGSRVT